MVREIVFDTETTGFDPENGDKLVEIGAVELINHIPTGVTFHRYINPQRDVPEDAFKVHGLSYDYLKQFPTFDKIVDEWLDFVGDGVLVAHNASFDIKFVNHEQKLLGKTQFTWDRVVDTLEIAKLLFPGSRVNLDALCKRFNVDNTDRTLHGALLDAQLWRRFIWSFWADGSRVFCWIKRIRLWRHGQTGIPVLRSRQIVSIVNQEYLPLRKILKPSIGNFWKEN